jgi:hypothetical protein
MDELLKKKKESELIEILKRIYEEIEKNLIVAEAASDIIWSNSKLGDILLSLQQKSGNAFNILLNILLTCTYHLTFIVLSN